MIASVGPSTSAIAATWAAPGARADGAIADYSRNVAGELAVVNPDANRDDVDAVGHRRTELRLDEAAA